ncbi:MAG: DnaA/Hda family protein [Anaerolineaceae bacterium]
MESSPASSRDLSAVWQAVLGHLQVELSGHSFNTWLRGTRALRLDGGRLIIEARTALSCEWLNIKLSAVVARAVGAQLGQEAEVEFVPRGSDAAVAARPEASPGEAPPAPPAAVAGHLNCAYTFERYLPGEGNQVAYESCTRLLERDGLPISPVVIYGPPGMGKTHLLHALACRALAASKRVACFSAEEFTTQYITAIRTGGMEAFQVSVRGVDLFVIDDLQYLAGKKGTLDELVHTIDAVSNSGGHIVTASERHPFDLDLPDRLSSRLAAGIITRVEPFIMQERREFIDHVARGLRAGLPTWAVERIAGCEIPSTRVLLGAVHAAVALSRCGRLDPSRLDADLMRVAAVDAAPSGHDDRAILEAIADHFETSFEALTGRSRMATVSSARAIAIYALKERGRSLSQIAALLAKRDPSTISQLQARGRQLLTADPALQARLAG